MRLCHFCLRLQNYHNVSDITSTCLQLLFHTGTVTLWKWSNGSVSADVLHSSATFSTLSCEICTVNSFATVPNRHEWPTLSNPKSTGAAWTNGLFEHWMYLNVWKDNLREFRFLTVARCWCLWLGWIEGAAGGRTSDNPTWWNSP